MKYIKIFSLVALALLFNACEQDFEDDNFRPRDRTSGWLEFPTESETVFTSSGEFLVPVEVNVPINKDGFNVNYTVEVISGNAPNINTGTFDANVPAGTREPNITLAIDPENISEYSIKVTLNSVDKDNITVGIPDSGRLTEFILGVTCPVPLEYSGASFLDGDQIGTFDVTLEPTDEPNEFTITSAWGDFVFDLTGDPQFAGMFQYTGTLIVNSDSTVEIVADDTDSFPDGGTGTIATCAGELNYTLTQAVFTGDFTVDVELNAIE